MVNIVVPMAGKSISFLRSKFKYPKYGVKISGTSILKRSLEKFNEIEQAKFYFVCLRDHYNRFQLRRDLLSDFGNVKIMLADNPTEGQASTALWSESYINNDDRLIIVSPTQLINWDVNNFFTFCDGTQADAVVAATDKVSTDSRYFSVAVDVASSRVKLISKPNNSSNFFDCGVYYFKYGWYYVRWAKEMIKRDGREEGEFWVAPCLNDGIVEKKVIRPFVVDEAAILRKPADVRGFVKNLPAWFRK